MKTWNRSLAKYPLLLPVLLLAACGGSSSGNDPDPVTLSSVAVTPATVSLSVGATQQLTATGTYSDSSSAGLAGAVWASDANSVASVSATGLVTALAAGTAHVSATSAGKSSSATVTVTATGVTLSSIALTPSPASVTKGATLQLVVTGTYSDASQQPLTATATFSSGTPAAATVTSPGGLVTGVEVGTSTITATAGGKTTTLLVTVTAASTGGGPATIATAPTQTAGAGVISLYSSTYAATASDQSAKVETWLTGWSGGGSTVNPFTIPGTSHEVKKYELKNYIGVEFIGGNNTAGDPNLGTKEIDLATPGMTHFHLDVWTPDGNHLVIKLIDAGPDKIVGTADDSTKITMGGITVSGKSQWVALDLDLGALAVQQAAWTGKNVAQIVIALDDPGAGGTMYVDNVYFYKAGGGGGGGGVGPAAPPAAPTATAANVMSLFSATYTGGTAGGDYSGRVDSYHASCFGPPGGASVTDYTITGTSHALKRYAVQANSFAIIELIGATGGTPSAPDSAICFGGTQSTTGATLIDVTAMAGFRFDVWSPAGSAAGTNIQIVSTDGTNTIAGPGAASGATMGTSYASGTTPIAAGQWVTIDFPFSSSGPPGAPAGLTKVGLVKIFFMSAGTYYVDNAYFYK